MNQPLSPTISCLKTEKQIRFIKEHFLSALSAGLKLHHVFAPLYVKSNSGLNDDLNGSENPITFRLKESAENYSIVHSLAKWKRKRLKELHVPVQEGIITNMIAIRPDETLSDMHSAFVDQWDWELHIDPASRNLGFLRQTVNTIYEQIRQTELMVSAEYPEIEPVLPEKITFIHSEDLIERYPGSTPKEREDRVAQEYGAVFIIGIGSRLANGEPHDGRAPDYDDWTTATAGKYKGLNGDIIVWHPTLKRAFELSSMGIRVDRDALLHQLELTGTIGRSNLPFHKSLLAGELVQSVGGGIGQSRLCMFMLRKKSISEVQSCEG